MYTKHYYISQWWSRTFFLSIQHKAKFQPIYGCGVSRAPVISTFSNNIIKSFFISSDSRKIHQAKYIATVLIIFSRKIARQFFSSSEYCHFNNKIEPKLIPSSFEILWLKLRERQKELTIKKNGWRCLDSIHDEVGSYHCNVFP